MMSRMTRAFLLAAFTFAAGLTAGFLVARERTRAEAAAPEAPRGGPVPETASGTADSGSTDVELDLKNAREKIRELKAELAELKGGEESADEPGAKRRAKDLRAMIPGLVEKEDGAGLLALMKELAGLGEAGWKGAMEIADIFRKEFGQGEEAFGLSKVQYNKAFTGAMTPLMTWALDHPEQAPGWFRAHSVHMLYWVADADSASIFLGVMGKEQDPNILAAMAGYMDRLAKPEMAGDIASLALLNADRPKTFGALLTSLVNLHSPESEAAIRRLAGDSNPAVRAAAELALVEHSPPAAGVMITTTRPKSQAESAGLLKGDIIVSYDGKDVKSLDQLRKEVQSKPDHQLVTVMVNRNGSLVPVQITGNWIGIDGRFVKPP
jgi:hypothetical protein